MRTPDPIGSLPQEKAPRSVMKDQAHTRKSLYQRLTRVEQRGNNRPSIGQNCLIVKGKNGVDEGQMGVITDQTAAMVEVTFLSGKALLPTTRLKRPSSLIMLEPGLIVTQGKDGQVWIQTEKLRNE
jgi:hypothetical protein